MRYVLGIDIGSTASKAVMMDGDRKIIAKAIEPHGTGTEGPENVYKKIIESSGIKRKDICRVMATGYGRFSFDEADSQKSEISCHAEGAFFVNPQARTIIDIGGQDVKAIRLNDEGVIVNFTMNDKCAAGTGRFLESMAKVLDVRMEDMGDISEKAAKEEEISNTCTVFAESEVISKLSGNIRIENLIAGIHRSVAKRVASLAFRNGIEDKVAMSGGVALNKAVVKALSEEIKKDIVTYEDSQYFGAIGAALFALKEADMRRL